VSIGKSISSETESISRGTRRWRYFETQRPGPKDCIQGEYPKGQDDFPVTGIRLVRSRGLCRVCRKESANDHHWNRAAGPFSASFIVPASNFGSSGVLPGGSKQDVSPWGNYDMAGNVKGVDLDRSGVRQALRPRWRKMRMHSSAATDLWLKKGKGSISVSAE
jgi:hypothetical protein